jgi:hypothetical protein
VFDNAKKTKTIWDEIGKANMCDALIAGIEQWIGVDVPSISCIKFGFLISQKFPINLKKCSDFYGNLQ